MLEDIPDSATRPLRLTFRLEKTVRRIRAGAKYTDQNDLSYTRLMGCFNHGDSRGNVCTGVSRCPAFNQNTSKVHNTRCTFYGLGELANIVIRNDASSYLG